VRLLAVPTDTCRCFRMQIAVFIRCKKSIIDSCAGLFLKINDQISIKSVVLPCTFTPMAEAYMNAVTARCERVSDVKDHNCSGLYGSIFIGEGGRDFPAREDMRENGVGSVRGGNDTISYHPIIVFT